jgi:hypothetical protein
MLPLSPKHLFLAYDGDAYSMPLESGWVELRKETEVQLLNEHQLLNAMSNVYFRDWAMAEEIAKEFESAEARRTPSRYRLNHAVLESDDGQTRIFRQTTAAEARDHPHALLHSEKLYPRTQAWPDFIRWRQGGVAYTNGSGMGFLRRAHVDSSGTRGFRKVKIDAVSP